MGFQGKVCPSLLDDDATEKVRPHVRGLNWLQGIIGECSYLKVKKELIFTK